MRIIHLLFLGISISLTTALTKVDNPDVANKRQTSTKPETTKTTVSTSATKADEVKSTGATTTRAAKSLRIIDDSRGKRNLYDFGNLGYLYSDVANRRAGYVDNSNSYYSQNGYYNGQHAIAQYPHHYPGPYSPYPQYLEAPEPIIEIIIKDSNETLPAVEQEPIVTKKKKEKVHVFYVNYKKDHNNKLHLESPIASLNNDDTEEEEEELVHIPAPVTPLPPLKTTTLRTVIHPDSEKYHSNSGIHVTFGTEDKSQTGHVLEEHDAESIQRQVVALPAGSNPNALDGLKSEDFNAPPQPRAPVSNQLVESPFQRAHYYQTQQQLPAQHNTHIFRPQAALTQNQQLPPLPPPQVSVGPQFYQKLPQPQPAKFTSQQAPPLPQPQALYSKVPTTQQQLQQQQIQQQHHQQEHQHQQQQQAHYYSNFNQQYQQFYQPLTHKPTQPPKSSFVFPTVPGKIQELPSHQSPAPYKPIKFRPTPAPLPQIKPVPIPAKLENTNYQTQSTTHQYKAQSNYQTHQQQYQTQQQQSPKGQTQPSVPYYFNRQPQFVRNPSFSVQSPAIPSQYKTQTSTSNIQNPTAYVHQKFSQGSTSINNYQTQLQAQPQAHIKPIKQNQNLYQTGQINQQYNIKQSQPQQQQQIISTTIPSSATPTVTSNQKPSTANLGALQTYFDIQPSRETELLKAIPKYEQHITETIHHFPIAPQSQTQSQTLYNSFTYNNQNQVIHDIPAPNLGPTSQPQSQLQSQSQNQQQSQQSQTNFVNITPAPLTGHYITATNHNSQPTQQLNYVTTSIPSSTSAPQYAETNSGQKIMIVTPMPPIIYNQYHSSHYTQPDTSSTQQQYATQHQQSSSNYAQQPRQSQSQVQSNTNSKANTANNSQYSVSTYHSDVFRELEQRKQQQNSKQEYQNQSQKQLTPTQQQSANVGLSQDAYIPPTQPTNTESQQQPKPANNDKASQTILQLPDEVPDDLREQLLSSGILNNADISVLDYDKVGSVNLENLPAEHLQHFYGNGGGAQISESRKVLNVVKPNGEQVSLSEKELERVKTANSIPKRHNLDVKVVRFDSNNEKSITNKYLKPGSTIVPPVDIGEKQYNRYLPLKINGAQFPIPETEELNGKKVVSVVVLAPVEGDNSNEARSAYHATSSSSDSKEVKFLSGDLIKTLVKKPTKENFKRWLEKEAKTDVEQQSVVLLVAKTSEAAEQEIFMYDITTQAINKLNGELSSKFVSVAEENASSEDLEHASTLDPSALEQMIQPSASHNRK